VREHGDLHRSIIILFRVAMKKSIFLILPLYISSWNSCFSSSAWLLCLSPHRWSVFPVSIFLRWCSTLFLLTRFSILRVQLPPAVFVPTRAWWGFSFARIQAGPHQGTPLPAVAAGCLLSFSAASGLRSSV
jgi:hypothetical protein